MFNSVGGDFEYAVIFPALVWALLTVHWKCSGLVLCSLLKVTQTGHFNPEKSAHLLLSLKENPNWTF